MMSSMTSSYEPTLYDVIEMLQRMEERLTTGAQSNFKLLSGRIDTVDERLGVMQGSINKLVPRVEEAYDEFLDTKDVHSQKLKNHDKRITRLETRPA